MPLKKPPPRCEPSLFLLDGSLDEVFFTVISRGSDTAMTVMPTDRSARKRLMHGMQAVMIERFNMT
jgi:hypothetical protein